MKTLGLVAGEGRLPLIFAEEAKKRGIRVVAFALEGMTSPDITRYADKTHWFKWGEFGKALMTLTVSRVRHVTMIGKIRKSLLFRGEDKTDTKWKELLRDIQSKKDYSILKGVGKVLEKLGVEVIDSATFLEDLIPEKGVLTQRHPTDREWDEIRFGVEIATEMAKLDIGQTICVRDKSVIAVEAAEGTDEAIRRAGTLVDGGIIVVKVARPNQDMRFDVPLVGLDTINTMGESKASALAIQERKTILMERDDVIRCADESGITIAVV